MLVDILINGTSTAFPGDAAFTYWKVFTVGGGTIQPGANTLTFITYNAGLANNPTGLRVQMCGWAYTTPQLKLDIDHTRSRTRTSWGSLPHKTYFIEHAADASGPWIRQPLNGIVPGSYRARYDDGHRFIFDPRRLYRVIEAP